ncbi:MAG: hypothetical protein AB3N17_12425 [Tateyamaria sp.]
MPDILYNLDQVQHALDGFPRCAHRSATRPLLYHSYKANTFAPLLRWLHGLGVGASVANAQELALAQELGAPAICATSPALDAAVIDRMRNDGVDVFLATPQQLSAVPDGSTVGIRLQVTKAGSPYPSRFGFAAHEPVLHDILRDKRLTVTSLLLHHRNIEAPGALHAHIETARMAQKQFPEVEWINLGGGKTALAQDAQIWDRSWKDLIDAGTLDPLLPLVSFEPGAQHLSGAGYLVANVLDRSQSDAMRQRLVLDASHWVLNGWSHIRPILPQGDMPTDLFGPTCYEDDVWCRATPMGIMDTGDVVGFANMGSYITSMARRFCCTELPAERLVRLGRDPSLDALRMACAQTPDASADLQQQDDKEGKRHEMHQDEPDQHLRV